MSESPCVYLLISYHTCVFCVILTLTSFGVQL